MSSLSLFAVCVFIWGTTWFAITAQLPVIAPEYGVAVRFGLSALALMLWCRARGLPLRFSARMHRLLAAQGLLGFFGSYVCVYQAERHVLSGIVAVGFAASPLVTLATARLLLGAPMSRRTAAGGAAGVAGVVMIFAHEFARLGEGTSALLGVGFTATAVLLSSLANMAVTVYQREGVHGWGPLAWAMGYGAAASALLGLVLGRPWGWVWSWPFLGSLAWLALAGSVLAFGAFNVLIHRIGAARAGHIGVMTPVVALLISSVFEGFHWTALTLGGVALALAGNAVALWPRRPADARAH